MDDVISVRELRKRLNEISRSIIVIERLKSEVSSALSAIVAFDITRTIQSVFQERLNTLNREQAFLLRLLKEKEERSVNID